MKLGLQSLTLEFGSVGIMLPRMLNVAMKHNAGALVLLITQT